MANRLCPLCGASYLDSVATCSECGVALFDPDDTEDPRTLPEDEQLVYELAGWTLDQRTEVAQVMAESGLPHAWDGDELFVHVRFEESVDRLLEPIEFPDGAPADGGEGIVALPAPEGDLTEYDLGEWSENARRAVGVHLAQAGIAYGWDETLLLVGVDDEEAVDDLLDDLESSGALDEVDDADDDLTETPGDVLEQLFLAADRLRKHPLDADGLTGLADALARSNPARPPFGLDPVAWRSITGLADQLADAETAEADGGTDASEDLVDAGADDDDRTAAQRLAADLRDALRPYV